MVKDASGVSRRPQTLALRKVQCIHAAAIVNYGLPVVKRALGRDLATVYPLIFRQGEILKSNVRLEVT